MYYIKYYWLLYVYCTTAGIFSLYLFIHKQYEYAKLWASKETDNPLDFDYDFIVVGSGSGGSLLAARLAENQKYNVLLVEAGGSPSFVHDIPLSSPLLQGSPYDWQYQTVPQEEACLGLNQKISKWPMGKVLGGTSRLNYMMYLRGHFTDFSDWQSGEDWTFSDVLHYFKKSENQLGRYAEDRKYHGVGGPVAVSDLQFRTELGRAVVEGLNSLGVPPVDLNTLQTSSGSMEVQVTCRRGLRWSSQHCLSTINTSTLTVLPNTFVNKVLIRDGVEAYGISYKQDTGRVGEVRAKHAVILSAGTVGSAKILLLSGIGPAEHLANLNIDMVANLPVGENLQDHITTGLDLILLNKTMFSLLDPLTPFQFIFNGSGLMSHPGCEAVAMMSPPHSVQPDLQFMALPAGVSTDAGNVLRHALHISDKLWEEYFSLNYGRQVATILVTLLHPKSRGYIRLRSPEPIHYPIINPNYLSNQADLSTLVKGLQMLEKLVKTEAMLRLGAELNRQPLPDCKHLTFASQAYWECYARHLTLTAYHPVGTCSMGDSPKTSVVDPHLRVHGIHGLYIVDGSVMPNLPSGNTQASVMMIAEKGADLIKLHTVTRFNTCCNSFLPPPPITSIDSKSCLLQ